MKAIDILSLLSEWEFDFHKYKEQVCSIGDVCAIRYDKKGKPFRRNYERGMLILAAAIHYDSRFFLEFGTGRGFGTACGLLSSGIRKIVTIDKLSAKKTIDIMPSDKSKVSFVCKDSMKLEDSDVDKVFDLVFIDGEHTERAVKNDFEYALRHTVSDAIIIFDDYRNKHKGVKKYIKSLKYDKIIVHSDGWIYKNRMLSKHGDADVIVNNKEAKSGQVILYKDGYR